MSILTPIILSAIAGSATGIGGLIVIAFGKVNDKILGFFLGFAGGVMLIVSFVQLFYEALTILNNLQVTITFAIGTIVMMVIDLTLPHIEFGEWEVDVKNPSLFKSGILIAIGMSLHNLPEGIVVSTGFEHLPKLGILVAIMICMHNIPEGIATTTPLIRSGVNKWRAVGLSLISGLMEPIGAIIGTILFSVFKGEPFVIGYGLAFAAGVMTYITVDELIPIAHEYCSTPYKHVVSTGLLVGMIFAQLLSLFLNI
jgi:ZIP family zinc transporter